MIDEEVKTLENEGGPVSIDDDVPQDVENEGEAEHFDPYTPTLLFILNFRAIYSTMAEVSGVGKSIKAPVAKDLVTIAAAHANQFTQIELQMRGSKNDAP